MIRDKIGLVVYSLMLQFAAAGNDLPTVHSINPHGPPGFDTGIHI